MAVGAMSKATTSKPRCASSSASSPSPHPTTRARFPFPCILRRSSHPTRLGLTSMSAQWMACSLPWACVYSCSNQPVASPRWINSWARCRAFARACSFIRLLQPFLSHHLSIPIVYGYLPNTLVTDSSLLALRQLGAYALPRHFSRHDRESKSRSLPASVSRRRVFAQDVECRAEFSQQDVEHPVVVRQCHFVSAGAQQLLVVLWLAQHAGQAHEFARGPPLVLFHPFH